MTIVLWLLGIAAFLAGAVILANYLVSLEEKL